VRSHRRRDLAALLLLCSIGVASTAGAGSFRASDDLVLTGAQERFIWRRVATQNIPNTGKQNAGRAPARSAVALFGEAVPPAVTLRALPANVTGQIPMVKPYAYTILGKQLLIVNPADRKIVDVITQ
jgi:hypothetical protein